MKKLRFNGRAMSKFDMAFEMKNWNGVDWTLVQKISSYHGMCVRFIAYCKENNLIYYYENC